MLTGFVYAGCALIWGTTWFAIRRCIGPGGYPTFAAAALRFAIASAVLGAIYASGRGRPGPKGRRQLAIVAACGVLCAVGYGLVYTAEESLSGGVAAVLYGTFPLCTALLATLGKVERVQRKAIAGSAVALVGIALVFADRFDVSHAQAVGVLLVLLSVFVSALYSTILKRVADDVNPVATTGVFLGTAAVVLGVFAAVFERQPVPWPPPAGPTVALLYLAVVGSVLVFAAYFYLMKRVSLMTVATLVLIEPIIALVVDAIGERDVVLGARAYGGILVTIVGVGVSVLGGPRAAPPPPPPSDATQRRDRSRRRATSSSESANAT
jgi:drug/metabolite transporter (DMT)-like permease